MRKAICCLTAAALLLPFQALAEEGADTKVEVERPADQGAEPPAARPEPSAGEAIDRAKDATDSAIETAKRAVMHAIDIAKEHTSTALDTGKEASKDAIGKASEATRLLDKASEAAREVLASDGRSAR